jgi:hypothetical protein
MERSVRPLNSAKPPLATIACRFCSLVQFGCPQIGSGADRSAATDYQEGNQACTQNPGLRAGKRPRGTQPRWYVISVRTHTSGQPIGHAEETGSGGVRAQGSGGVRAQGIPLPTAMPSVGTDQG